MTDKKHNQVMKVLVKIHDDAKEQISNLIMKGTLTVAMMDFEYDRDDEELEVMHTITHPDGTTSNVSKVYYINFRIEISDYM